ncbi:MAG: NUDIX domain-containing protein [Acetivibrionales bacterium]|jgi:ADP-ribose pyrophosphatase
MKYEEKTISKKKIFQGKILDLELHTVALPNGKESTREIVLHPGAAVVIPISENGELYMVRQYRKPLEKVMLELPAGKLDPGEAPIECAKRELKEETGLEARVIEHIVSVYSTPGFSNEVLHMFIAKGLEQGDACADEDEFISTEKISIGKLIEKVLDKEITDAKTIIGILLADKIIKQEIK